MISPERPPPGRAALSLAFFSSISFSASSPTATDTRAPSQIICSVMARSPSLIPRATGWPLTSMVGSMPTGTAMGLIFSVGRRTLKPLSTSRCTMPRTSTFSTT